jgi:hypothetical protein
MRSFNDRQSLEAIVKKTSNHKTARKLTLHKMTVRVLGDMELGRVNGGVNTYDEGICVGQSFDRPCPEPILF